MKRSTSRKILTTHVGSLPRADGTDRPSGEDDGALRQAVADVVARQRFLERVRTIARSGTTLILITHHVEEIIPEIEQVVLLKNGRIAGEGPTKEMMTAATLSDVFDGPIVIEEKDGYFAARSG